MPPRPTENAEVKLCALRDQLAALIGEFNLLQSRTGMKKVAGAIHYDLAQVLCDLDGWMGWEQ